MPCSPSRHLHGDVFLVLHRSGITRRVVLMTRCFSQILHHRNIRIGLSKHCDEKNCARKDRLYLLMRGMSGVKGATWNPINDGVADILRPTPLPYTSSKEQTHQ